MAMIKRMSLQGVRSFGPEEKQIQWIEFGSPLTLILGVNGSGKTTIIEALKYTITGKFPPNSANGASFVNDPKLTHSSMAMAKIGLELHDLTGRKYSTGRKVKATIKNDKGDLSMSQLDATLKITTPTGEVIVINPKCADIKREMSRIMGVSEAVLNHVIFCHQEESCWPLDEGKKVKETFDAIFNTMAYKKCFDRFGAIDKDLGIKIKVEQEGLSFVKENRELAIKYRNDLDDKRIKLQQQLDSIQEYSREVVKLEEKLREFQALEAEYSKKQSEVTEKKTTIQVFEKQIRELRDRIKDEFPGGISDLKDYIRTFGQECTDKLGQIKKHDREYREKDKEWSKLDQEKSKLIKEEGMFQQEENANKKRVDELHSHMSEVVAALKSLKQNTEADILSESFTTNLDACEASEGELSFEIVAKALNCAIRVKEGELQKTKTKFTEEENELQANIDTVRTRMASTVKEVDMKQQQLNENKKTYEDTRKRLKALEGSSEAMHLLDDDVANCVSKIEAIEKSGFMTKCDSEIKSLTGDIKELESKISTTNGIWKVLNEDKSKADNITLFNRQKMQKQTECREKFREMEDDLTQIFDDIPDDHLGDALESKLKSLMKDLKEQKIALKKNEGELAGSKSELKFTTSKLKESENKLKDWKRKVEDVFGDKTYDQVYDDIATDLDKTQQDYSYAEAGIFLYKKFFEKLSKKDCCPLCKRGYEAREELRKLSKEIEDKLKQMTENKPRYKKEMEELKERQEKVLKSKPMWEECHRLETETLPTFKSKKMELDEKMENLKDNNEAANATLTALESDLTTINNCRSKVAVYEQCKTEVKRYEDQIAKIEKSRDPVAKRQTMSLEDAETELEEHRALLTNKRSEKENKQELRNKKRDELAKLNEEKNSYQEKKLQITAELQNKGALDTQRKELEVATKNLQEKINELKQSVPTLKTDIAKAERSKKSCVQRKEDALKKLGEEKDLLDKKKYNIFELNKKILEFEKRKGRAAAVKQQVADCQDSIAECEKCKKEIAKQIDLLKRDVANQELKKRELDDNLSLKEKLEMISKLKVELAEKENLLSQADNRGAAAQKRTFLEKHQLTTRRLNELQGSSSVVKQSIKDLEQELNRSQFKNAESQYIMRVAKKLTYEKAQKDVRRYKTALDHAIMQFHNKKMAKINKILLEYWRRIYRGNDIDKIMIKTEADKEPGSESKPKKVKVTTASTRKSYNYRVVMSRRGVDIDMRGRCSAGQRVLASIIIRIALAESFGARCGIITLDEPTTNLDQKNINSLADALAELADKMATRKMFQLIVITHDQEFTQRLSGVDAVEKYWKVDRDHDGFSRITQVLKRAEGYGPSYR